MDDKQPRTVDFDVGLDSIATQLIKNRFILTALELHTELVELGKELPILRDYFSNPSNFELCTKSSVESAQNATNLNRSSSQTTLDSLDWARYSEDGERALDDRVAVLEFELRKAKETIQGLRDNLTQVTANNDVNPAVWQGIGERKFSSDSNKNEDLRPHEVCTLNFLINEYLVMRHYKLTAITFADENDNQDFENWDDVGLNIPRPPTLVQWLREKIPDLAPKSSVLCQTDDEGFDTEFHTDSSEEIKHLQEKVTDLESLCERQELELQKLQRKMSTPHVTPLGSPHRKKYEGELYDSYENMSIEIENKGDNEHQKVRFAKANNNTLSEEADESLVVLSTGLCPSVGDDDEETKQQDDTCYSDYVGSNIESIEDFIENSPRQVENKGLVDVLCPSSTNEAVGVVTMNELKVNGFSNFKPEGEIDEESGADKTESHAEESTALVNAEDLLESESNEVLDPRKCDRLPPLGASSECSPQGVLVGEFIGAQREEAKSLLRSSATRETPKFLETQILNVCFGQAIGVDSRLQNQIAALSFGQCDLLNLVSSSLHTIAPNVILAKREELLPLLVYSISQHMDGGERERLLHLLFNLTKKPDKEQRNTILLGLVNLARVLGPEKLEAELLPQCWEQLSHKYQERRLLVAQSVAILAPYTPPTLRNSLLLSMLLQLLGPGGEKDVAVREAALGSLSLLVSYLDDAEKLPSLVNTLVLCLEMSTVQNSSKIVDTHQNSSGVILLYSSLAYWSLEAGTLQQFIAPQIERIVNVSQDISLELTDGAKRSRVGQLLDNLCGLYKGLSFVCPYIILYLYKSLPKQETESSKDSSMLSSQGFLSLIDELSAILDNRKQAEIVVLRVQSSTDGKVMEDLCSSWNEFKFIANVLISSIAESVSFLDPSCKVVIKEIIHFVSQLCCCLGPRISCKILSPPFLKLLEVKDQQRIVQPISSGLAKASLIVYIVGILACPDSGNKIESLQDFLSKHISESAVAGTSVTALQMAISLLLEYYHCHEVVLSALWNCIVNEKPSVRRATAPLWELLVDHVQEAELASKVVPALVTLATDTEVDVRAAAISPLGYIIANTSSKEVTDKVMLQLESLCEEAQVIEHPYLQIAIAQCCSALGPNSPPNLLHHLFLPCLCRASLEGHGTPEEKLRFGAALLEAFSALASLPMPDHLVAHFVLPPLNQLQKTLGAMSLEHMDTITVLTKEYTLRAQSSNTTERVRGSLSATSLSSLGSSLSSSVGAMGAGLPIGSGVEDVKNKMSKMFSGRSGSLQARTASLNIPTIFRKK